MHSSGRRLVDARKFTKGITNVGDLSEQPARGDVRD